MEDIGKSANLDSVDDDAAEVLELEQELYTVQDEAKRIDNELAASKKRKAQLKKEIAERHQRFHAMKADKRKDARAEFEDSMQWRAREVDLIQARIKALEAQAAIARESIRGVALHLEPFGINTSPRARRHGGPNRSQRQREIRARARENRWDGRMNKLRTRLKSEREQGAPARADLEAAAASAENKLAQIASVMDQAKVQIKKRKRELNEWKQWYASQPEIDKTDRKAALDREVEWRAREIQDLQTRIGTLEGGRLTVEGELEAARIQLEALLSGAYERPLDDDPRLAHIQMEREAAAAALVRTRKFARRRYRKKSAGNPKTSKPEAAQHRKSVPKRRRK